MISKTQSTPASQGNYQTGTKQVGQSEGRQQAAQTGTQDAGEQEQTGLGQDESQAKQPAQKEDVEANVVSFSPGGQAEPGLQLQDFGDDEGDDSGYFDPGVRALQNHAREQEEANSEGMEVAGRTDSVEAKQSAKLDENSILSMIQEMDYKLTKDMLDMIQRSLDRAKKLMEQNSKDYYQKVLPQLQAVEKQLKQVKALEASSQHKQAVAQVQQLDKLSQALTQALAQSPDFSSNPAAKAILAELSTIRQLSSQAKQ